MRSGNKQKKMSKMAEDDNKKGLRYISIMTLYFQNNYPFNVKTRV